MIDYKTPSISKNLTISLVIVIIILSTMFIGIFYYQVSKNTAWQLEKTADEYIHSIAGTLEIPLWDMDRENINTVCNYYIQNEWVIMVKLTGISGEVMFQKNIKDQGNFINRSREISYDDEIIGRVEIALSSFKSHKDQIKSVKVVVTALLVCVIGLVFFTGFLLKKIIKEPMAVLGRIAESYSKGDYHPKISFIRYKEFNTLVSVLFKMGETIESQMNELRNVEASLKKHRDSLEETVEERTEELQEELNERKQVENELKNTSHILDERVKELNCLYGISSLIEKPKITLGEILQGAVDLIPPSWQYPEITSAIIIIENQEFRTENYKETAWEQSANIILQGKKAGVLKVYYIKEKPNIDESPFLNEERFLIDTIAEQLSRIIEYKHSEITLRETKKAAEHANLVKSEFLASVSHELRTPLNAVLGFAKVMSKDKNFPAHHGDHVAMIRQSGEILLALINQILDLSKIESGQMSVVETTFDLYSILDEINKMFSLLNTQKRLTLSIECGEDIPRNIVTDELKLRQVLINLISNALKFTEKGNVSLVVQSIDNSSSSPDCPVLLHFDIKDTGPGISREEIGLLFNPFTQTEAGKKSHQGTGLGLSISQKFVELLGGEITVKSQLEKGTTFSFTIPVGKTSYSDKNQTRTSITISNAGPDISQDTLKTELKSLSQPLIHKIEEAATYCEIDDIHQIILQVENRHPNLAGELERLVKEFDFDGILTLIKEMK